MYELSHHKNKIIRRAIIRRRKERFKTILRFSTALMIVMTLATLSLSIRGFAGERNDGPEVHKYYTSHTVEEGESLSSIAEKYISDEYTSMDKYISEVVSINRLISAGEIYPGQALIFPYYSVEARQ
ncbi:MAG: LysM peptidoglycan-binding domain-containing protein [Lachnospiraceae bacterium]|nr:LysM peptidoglycan-binding domain-containing protein [Lachnospiraceae bacterium]